MQSLLDAAGGCPPGAPPPRAVLFGGYAGAWVDGQLLRALALSDEHLAPHGASLGAGVVALLSAEACPVAETARVTRWMAPKARVSAAPA